MQRQTILNRVERYKSFVYKKVSWDESASRLTLRVFLDHRSNGRPVCSGCGRVRPGYDRLRERTWEFVPLWQIAVLFVYAPRRVDCPECGVVVERLPWGDGKFRQTRPIARKLLEISITATKRRTGSLFRVGSAHHGLHTLLRYGRIRWKTRAWPVRGGEENPQGTPEADRPC